MPTSLSLSLERERMLASQVRQAVKSVSKISQEKSKCIGEVVSQPADTPLRSCIESGICFHHVVAKAHQASEVPQHRKEPLWLHPGVKALLRSGL